jgi:hypothetical protein
MACRWLTSALMVYRTLPWQSESMLLTLLSSKQPIMQIRFLWSKEKISLLVSKSRENQNSAPRPATKAPHGEFSIKRTRKGGKCEKARKACAAHNIVSSAFVSSAVLNRMQESHYLESGPSTSCVKEVVEQPAPTPVPTTIIGGPS